jgi:hypothetical protein
VEQVINSLGNFDQIKIPAKKASRIGLSFGSSIPYFKSENFDVLIVDDDLSPKGIEYTDGIG